MPRSFGPTLAAVLIATAAMLHAANADGDQSGAVQPLQGEARRARELVNRLKLSPRQARGMLAIAERAAALHVAYYEWQASRLPEAIEAFAAFAAEDARGQGFSPEVERRARAISHALKQKREQLTEALIGLEVEAAKCLTLEQRCLLDQTKSPRRPQPSSGSTPDRLALARQESADLASAMRPAPGPLGRYLLHPAAGPELARTAGVALPLSLQQALDVLTGGTSAHPRAEFERNRAQVERLRNEINNWNLINGLNFTVEQMQRIIALYDECANQAVGLRQRRQQTVALEQAVAEVLNAGQREVLRTYKPCLIPPRNLKDPVRVGQANDSSQLERWLERARRTPAARLPALVEGLLQREAEHYGPLSRAEQQKRKELLIRTARRAAAMSDVDFALRQCELAEQIAPRDRAQMLRDEIDTLARQRGQPGVLARFLLRPDFIDQLRQRLAATTETLAATRSDPTAVQAEPH